MFKRTLMSIALVVPMTAGAVGVREASASGTRTITVQPRPECESGEVQGRVVLVLSSLQRYVLASWWCLDLVLTALHGIAETIAERKIREAMEHGMFTNLDGAGKPIEDLDRSREPDQGAGVAAGAGVLRIPRSMARSMKMSAISAR